MSMDAGGLAQMTYNSNNNAFSSTGIGAPGHGFGNRSRLSNKRLSVALPPKVNSISENQVDNPTPRTSRSHLLAGLRTQPKAPATPASAPYQQTEHMQGMSGTKWAQNGYAGGYGQGVPQTATGSSFGYGNQYAMNAGQQTYALPQQVLAPPNMYEEADEMDPVVLQQMQMTSYYLAQRKEQLQQQLANLTQVTQGMSLNTNMQQHNPYNQSPMTPQTPQNYYGQQQMMSPVEVQPGVYLVYNPAIQGYSYVVDQNVQQQMQNTMSPGQYGQASAFSQFRNEPPTPTVQVSPPAIERSTPANMRSFSPPKKTATPPSTLEHVEPLPPPSSTAFRRGHKKASSLAINLLASASDGPRTASAATFGSQRVAFPPTPATGGFGPGAARAGEHPIRQPRGPPAIEELTAAPTSKHEGSKNFATRQRRAALDSLMKAGIGRRGVSASRSASGSPVNEGEHNSLISDDGMVEDLASIGSASASSRKMSPIGSEMKEKRGSQGSMNDGYFGLSSASSSEGEEASAFKQPPTPATPVVAVGGERKKMMLGVLSAAEKRRSFIF
ncbi:hypothetical protein LTR91_012732 [Friedmanniomyces endolithicus]|uniref:Uncharacterized protein n=1 Tax=Friedmanniomyces endolithicus TaxID=329885 RepID=A0AAN6KF72_9PEZI|nr:hypothetical protein LTR57_018759 [Friedmanniomyces endolithicus]KAK0964256.1 hypothetical protein LTS01_018930 [Friedmanniomyces endolithicus]KAK0979133.1 hypothetical protein LTR91_012732 [Friedmanniomyces endolithicus]KAK1032640.1 hypothetical protein LTS16_016996 [Friedmanniomyces endolithicus]